MPNQKLKFAQKNTKAFFEPCSLYSRASQISSGKFFALLPKKTAKNNLKAKKSVALQEGQKLAESIDSIKQGLYNLKAPFGAHKGKRILGRGSSSGHGKTSTRGSKGQTSRSGRATYPGFEGGQMPLIRRMPKRGFSTERFKKSYQIVNLKNLNKIKENSITLDLLKEGGLIKDKEKLVKILGEGEIKAPITIYAHAISDKALKKIQEAGGKVEIINA